MDIENPIYIDLVRFFEKSAKIGRTASLADLNKVNEACGDNLPRISDFY